MGQQGLQQSYPHNRITLEKMDDIIRKVRSAFGDMDNIRERTYLAIGVMEHHCHMKMNGGDCGLDFDIMRDLAADTVLAILKGE